LPELKSCGKARQLAQQDHSCEELMQNLEIDMKETLITLTSDIVAAHVSNNDVAVADVPGLITNVYAALANLGQTPVVEEAKPQPAVAVRNSVKPEYIVCLEDGNKLKMLKRYLRTNYNMSPEEYRARWGLAADYPMVAPNYAEKRRDLAMKIGLGRKPGTTVTKSRRAKEA
jgi:predicted transcriptional regulator